MAQIYHNGNYLGNGTPAELIVKETVGWTGKNRAYSQTNNAVIAHIDNGITYDVSWTGSATVTLKKNSASGTTITSGNTSPLSFTADADYELYFGSSATVTNIMVKDSRITDPTYEPYHDTVEEEIEGIYADNGVLGAKNLLFWKTASGSDHSVDFTVNTDKTIIANGTATDGNAIFYSDMLLGAGTYILNGTATGGQIQAYLAQSPWTNYGYDTGSGVEFTLSSDATIRFQCIIPNGTTANNAVFKPMLRLASDPDTTYQPYAMTNRELTEKVFEKRLLSSSDNLNDITKTGIYGIETAPTNSPENINYATLIVQSNNADNIRQVIVTSGDNWGNLFIRSKRGAPASWKPWIKMTGTVVS